MAKGIAPSGGMLKKLFDPATMKKKMKTSMNVAPAGGPKIKPAVAQANVPAFKPRLTKEKPKLMMARAADKVLGAKRAS